MAITNTDEKEIFGLVLSSTAYKESDLILQVLLEGIGKQSLIARGARKSKRRFFGGIEVFDSGKFLISDNKQKNFLQLQGISERVYLYELRNNLFSLKAASLLVEIAHKLIPDEDSESSKLLPVLNNSLSIISKSNDKLKTSAILCNSILQICNYSGIDPSEEELFFRPDDKNWFTYLINNKDIRTFEPLEASLRAINSLAEFIKITMQVSIKGSV